MFMEVIFTKASARIYQVESVELRAALTNTNIQTTDTIGFHITYTAMRIYHILS